MGQSGTKLAPNGQSSKNVCGRGGRDLDTVSNRRASISSIDGFTIDTNSISSPIYGLHCSGVGAESKQPYITRGKDRKGDSNTIMESIAECADCCLSLTGETTKDLPRLRSQDYGYSKQQQQQQQQQAPESFGQTGNSSGEIIPGRRPLATNDRYINNRLHSGQTNYDRRLSKNQPLRDESKRATNYGNINNVSSMVHLSSLSSPPSANRTPIVASSKVVAVPNTSTINGQLSCGHANVINGFACNNTNNNSNSSILAQVCHINHNHIEQASNNDNTNHHPLLLSSFAPPPVSPTPTPPTLKSCGTTINCTKFDNQQQHHNHSDNNLDGFCFICHSPIQRCACCNGNPTRSVASTGIAYSRAAQRTRREALPHYAKKVNYNYHNNNHSNNCNQNHKHEQRLLSVDSNDNDRQFASLASNTNTTTDSSTKTNSAVTSTKLTGAKIGNNDHEVQSPKVPSSTCCSTGEKSAKPKRVENSKPIESQDSGDYHLQSSLFDFSEKFFQSLKLDNNLEDEQLSEKKSFSSNSENNNNNSNKKSEIKQSNTQQAANKVDDQADNIWKPLDWNDIANRYRKMPRKSQSSARSGNGLASSMRNSCCGRLFVTTLITLFPIFDSFRDYRLPGDLLVDLFAGFTIAVLQIPQGMAYGLLAGTDPIYGLYTSFVPVFIMALMSKSRHVSYGTFAVCSMLMANSVANVKLALKSQSTLMTVVGGAGSGSADKSMEPSISSQADSPVSAPLIIVTNNHQPIVADQSARDSLLRILAQQPHETNESLLQPPINANGWSASDQTQMLALDFAMPNHIEILTCLCLFVGIIQIVMALTRLGALTLMFSDQLVSSFTTAAAVHVVASQLNGLFDIHLPHIPEQPLKIFKICITLADKLLAGFNQYTALLSLLSILFLLFIKDVIEPKLKQRFKSLICLPSELILMSLVIFASWYWQFNDNYDIRIIGYVPTGLPAPQVPRLELVPYIAQDSVTIALITFAMNLSLAQVYAKRFKYKIEPNQELFAFGASNLVGSFFSCFPCASSLSRTAVQSNLNARSQLCALFSCAIVVSIICFFAPILHDLPKSTLSCIIVVALRGILMQVRDLYENWRLSKLDALVWMVTFGSVISFGVSYGLILGIAASLFMVFFRLLTPNHSILGQLPGTEIYVDSSAFVDCREVDQVKIFRFNSALCYLNRTMFKSSIEKSLPSIYKPRGFDLLQSWRVRSMSETDKTLYLIIDCSALAYCDYSGAATLVEIIDELAEFELMVLLAACPMKLIDMLEKMKMTRVLEHNVFPSISDAVAQTKYLRNMAKLSKGEVKQSFDLSSILVSSSGNVQSTNNNSEQKN